MIKTLNKLGYSYQRLSRHTSNVTQLLETINKRTQKEEKIKNSRLCMEFWGKFRNLLNRNSCSNLNLIIFF